MLATADETPLLVFDEVDAGVGGRNASALGERLRTLGRYHQVLCVTHLAQVAAHADAHIVVGKRVAGGRTTTEATLLSTDERTRELAAMLGGEGAGAEAQAAAEALPARAPPRRPDVPLTDAIDAFLLELRVERGLSPLTISAYRRDLAQFAAGAGRGWRDDPKPLLEFVRNLQRSGARGSTQARKSAAVRSFYGFALREGHATRDVPALVDAPRPGTYLPDVLAPDRT